MNADVLAEAVAGATVDEGFGPVTVDVPADAWPEAARVAAEELGCTFLDFLTAVHDPDGVRVVLHVVCLQPFGHLLLRTLLPEDAPRVASLAPVYAGAAWHERETAEMFGVVFLDAAGDVVDRPRLLLPPALDAHPLRKDFPLASRLDRPWPGDKDFAS